MSRAGRKAVVNGTMPVLEPFSFSGPRLEVGNGHMYPNFEVSALAPATAKREALKKFLAAASIVSVIASLETFEDVKDLYRNSIRQFYHERWHQTRFTWHY